MFEDEKKELLHKEGNGQAEEKEKTVEAGGAKEDTFSSKEDFQEQSAYSEISELQEEESGANGLPKDYEFYRKQGERTERVREEEERGAGAAFYHERVKESEKKAPKKGWKRFIAACLIISVVGGGSMGASLAWTQDYLSRKNSGTETIQKGSTTVKTAVSKVNSGKSIIEIIKEVTPSVVSISTKGTNKATYFGGFQVPYELSGAGSGVIFYSEKDKVGIATNEHVIANATEINVTFAGDKMVKAKVVGTDSTSDLAVISVDKKDLKAAGIQDVKIATFGNSNTLEVGEDVVAIGNALGEGLTATNGIISATEKVINIDGKQLNVIQTNAAINPGNSGGALVNSDGQVIGINTAKSFESAVEGMGYAIPSNIISPIIDKLLTEGTAPRPYLGIRGSDIGDEEAQLYKLPIGVLVREIISGSGAEKAGLQPGDIITEFGGKKIMNMEKLVEILGSQKVGSTAQVHIIRNGEIPMDLNVTILDANKME